MAVHSKTNGPDPAAEPDPFEFSSAGLPGSPPAMCAADDVFLAGKILPFGASTPKRHQNSAGKLRSRDLLEVNRSRTMCAADDIFFTGKTIPSSGSPPKREKNLGWGTPAAGLPQIRQSSPLLVRCGRLEGGVPEAPEGIGLRLKGASGTVVLEAAAGATASEVVPLRAGFRACAGDDVHGRHTESATPPEPGSRAWRRHGTGNADAIAVAELSAVGERHRRRSPAVELRLPRERRVTSRFLTRGCFSTVPSSSRDCYLLRTFHALATLKTALNVAFNWLMDEARFI